MSETSGNTVDPVHSVELARWFDRAHAPWNPIMAAERQFDALIGDSEDHPALPAYDHLYDRANQGLRWLELNSCPDRAIGRRLKAEMMAYRAVADTVRSTVAAAEGDAMVAQLMDLREMIDQHADAIDAMTARTNGLPENGREEGEFIMKHRRRVPRQIAGWEGTCRIVGDSAAGSWACRVIDISMLGLGMTFNHASPSELLGRRISVEVPAVGDSFSLQLEGVVKNAVPTLEGAVRVGIAFDGLSESEPGFAAVHRMKSGLDGDGRRRIRSR
jgi:PilZ domain